GINSMMQAVRGEYKGSGKTVAERKTTTIDNSVWVAIWVLIIFFFIRTMIGWLLRRGYRYSSSGGPSVSWWPSGGGGWSSGGSSGGGFSGFSGGGGSFGGGGAGSSW